MSKPLVYVSGPLTTGEQWKNCSVASEIGLRIYRMGGIPVVPHLWSLTEVQGLASGYNMGYEDWMEIDLETLSRCHAVFRFGGESAGADREVEHAKRIGIPIFSGTMHSRHDIVDWIKRFPDV